MNKLLAIVSFLLIIISMLFQFVLRPIINQSMLNQVMLYDRITHEEVFNTDIYRNKYYSLGDNQHPGDYGFTQWSEVEYPSIFDNDITLNAWWIPSASQEYGGASAPVIMLNHGRTSNRLKTLKYLKLYRDLGLDKQYNFFIPDHRNSGKSSQAPTELGNKFAEDITAATLYCNKNYGSKQFSFHSFSMGAMATAIFLHRKDLVEQWQDNNINIERIILDSPLSHAKLTMIYAVPGTPNFIINPALDALNKEVTDSKDQPYFYQMYLSNLLENFTSPILVLNNIADTTTPYNILKPELEAMQNHQLTIELFEALPKSITKSNHVQMYPHQQEQYIPAIKTFFGI